MPTSMSAVANNHAEGDVSVPVARRENGCRLVPFSATCPSTERAQPNGEWGTDGKRQKLVRATI